MKYCMNCGSWYSDRYNYCEVCNAPHTEKAIEHTCSDGYLIKLTSEEVGEIIEQMKNHTDNPITLNTDEII